MLTSPLTCENMLPMNETLCERCGEDEAVALIEHVLYAEAVCAPCRKDEYDASERDANAWDMKVMREQDSEG